MTSAEWTSHQANRLTLTHRGSKPAQPPPPPSPILPLLAFSPGYTHKPRTLSQKFIDLLSFVTSWKRGARKSWEKKTLTDFMWVLWVNWILFYSLEIQSLPLSMPNDWEQICLWTIFILMLCGSDQKPLERPNYSQIIMDSESFLVGGICSSHEMIQNKLVCFLLILHSVIIDTWFWKGKICALSEDSYSYTVTTWCCAQRSSVGRAEILKRSHSSCHLEKRQCDTNLPI